MAIKSLIFSVDALWPSDRLKFWSGLLPQGNHLKLAINIKYGAFISDRSSHTWISLVPQAPELITAFDEHRVSLNFKFGILCQTEGQVWDRAAGVRATVPHHNLSDGLNLSAGHRGGYTQQQRGEPGVCRVPVCSGRDGSAAGLHWVNSDCVI